MRRHDACVVWVGKHEMLPAQWEAIRRHLGDNVLVERVPWVETAERLVSVISRLKGLCRRIIVTGTMPLSVYSRLAELQDEAGFEVWYPVMEEVNSGVPLPEAMRLAMEDRDRRTYQCYARGEECRVFEFKEFKRLRRVILQLEDIE